MTQVDDELWSAIGDPSRRRVLDLLVSHGEGSASWLAGQVPFSRQAVSKHLVVLEEAGLVSRRKQGREILYLVEADRLDQAARAMADLAAQWDHRLAAVKRLAEAAHAESPSTPRDGGLSGGIGRSRDEGEARRRMFQRFTEHGTRVYRGESI